MGDIEPDLWKRNPCLVGGGADVAAVVVGLLWSGLVRDDGCEAVV